MVKQRWESLRSQYRKNRRRKTLTGVAIGSESKWKYEDHLDFLRAYMKEREVLTPQFFSEDTFILSEDGEEVAEEEYIADIPQWQNNESLSHLSQSSYNPVPKTMESSISETGVKSRSKRKKESATGNEVLNMLKKYLRNQEKADLESMVSKDPLDFFFDGMKCTVNKFSEADKYLAKQKIFSIVSEIEAKYVV